MLECRPTVPAVALTAVLLFCTSCSTHSGYAVLFYVTSEKTVERREVRMSSGPRIGFVFLYTYPESGRLPQLKAGLANSVTIFFHACALCSAA
jgi:hypothetical protein